MKIDTIKAKRKHHFVWAWHLSNWSTNKRDLYYLTSTGKVGYDSVKGLAREVDFYRASTLTARQIQIARRTIELSSYESGREFLLRTLDKWISIQSLVANAEASVLPEYRPELQRAKEALECNFIEELHSIHELLARKALEKLSNDDLSVLSDQEMLLPLCLYVGQAAMRTKPLRDGVANVRGATMLSVDSSDFQEAWWFLSFVYGSNLGQALMLSIDTLSLLTAPADCPFIITDHPVVNMHPDWKESLDLVMPLSPARALAFCQSGQFQPGPNKLSCKEVDAINRTLAEHSATVFASSEAQVKQYAKYVSLT